MRHEGPAASGILVTVFADLQLVIDVMPLQAVCNNEQLFALYLTKRIAKWTIWSALAAVWTFNTGDERRGGIPSEPP